MRVFFYRHLPTYNNLNGLFMGRLDVECDDDYIRENREGIESLSNKREFKCLYCSPLKRARESARLLFPGVDYLVDRRLIERDLGEWNGLPKTKVREAWNSAFFSNGSLDFSFTPPNGESFKSVKKRVSSFLLDLYDNYKTGDEIAVITHNGIITAVKCLETNANSTENIHFQSFLSEYVVDMTPSFHSLLIKAFL